MSRTDAHRPVWVHDFFDGSIDHDHAGGECVVETFEFMRWQATSRANPNRHYDACPRTSYSEYRCDDPDGNPGRTSCWRVYRELEPCVGHSYLHTDYSAECAVCDSRPPIPTCDRRIPGSYWWRVTKLYGDHVPGDICNLHERGKRREKRDVLRAAAKDYNTHGETDIEPAPAWHRHAAAWYYW